MAPYLRQIRESDRVSINTDEAWDLVTTELTSAVQEFPAFNGAHEGYAVILEELDEMWAEVKANEPTFAVKEAVQVAAMAIRFILDVSDKYGVRKSEVD